MYYKKLFQFHNIVLLMLILMSMFCISFKILTYQNSTSNDCKSDEYKEINIIYDQCNKSLWNKESEETYEYYWNLIRCNNDGQFYYESIDYTSQRSASWPLQAHLIYTKNMLCAYGREEFDNDDEMQEIVLGLMDYWLNNDFICKTNWWPNNIGVPRHIAELTIMIKPYLDDTRLNKISKILDRGTIGKNSEIEQYDAANLIDILDISLKRARIYREPDLIHLVSNKVGETIKINSWGENGIQSDFTYFDHGNVLTTGGSYGVVYTEGISNFIYLLHDTSFSIDEEKEKLYLDYMLDGERFFHRNNGTPQFSIGRSASYANGGEKVYNALKNLIGFDDLYRNDEIRKYYLSYKDFTIIEPEIKYFPLSGTLVALSKDYYMAIRGAQSGMGLTDIYNGQGILNYNLSYGSNTCYMYEGNEYSSIGAVLDFSMYPGTTTHYESDDELTARYEKDYNETWGRTPYSKSECYCIVDETKAAAVMSSELYNDDISGKMTYIIYKGVLFVLGRDFNTLDLDNSKDIITTVDQCKASADSISILNGKLSNGESIINRAYRYQNLCDSDITYEINKMSGNYKRNDQAGDESQVEQNVFKAYFNWGKSLSNICFSYAVVPCNLEYIPAIYKIINNKDISIIEFKDGTCIGFSNGKVLYNKLDGNTIKPSENGIFIE